MHTKTTTLTSVHCFSMFGNLISLTKSTASNEIVLNYSFTCILLFTQASCGSIVIQATITEQLPDGEPMVDVEEFVNLVQEMVKWI